MEDVQRQKPVTKWQPPTENFVKINFDGSYFEATGSGSWGFVIPDHRGEVQCAGAGRLTNILDALQAEAEACIQALKAAVIRGMGRVILETDALNLKYALEGMDFDLARNRVVFREAKFLLFLFFLEFRLMYCPRASNSVTAHKLASFSSSLEHGDTMLWMDQVPNCVNSSS